MVTFNALRELGRVALTEANGNIFMAFGSHPDIAPAHGWVLSVNAQTMALTGVLNLTPNGKFGDIWQDGNEFLVDGSGDLFFGTGNGTFDSELNAAGFPINGDYGNSIVKIAVDPSSTPVDPNVNGWGLKVVDYFTPSNQQFLDDNDWDLNSGGAILLPPAAGNAANPSLMIQGSKYGTEYLLHQDSMGCFNSTTDQVVQEVPGFRNPLGIFSTPAYFNGTLYYATVGTNAKAYSLTNGTLSTIPTSESHDTFGYPGATPVISANGKSNGIVWTIDNGTNELRAYDASNLAHELYNSDDGPGGADALGEAVKFSVPTVADGHVFVGTQNSLVIYGLLNPSTPANANRLFVNAAYESILRRTAEPTAVATWAQALDHGTSRTALTTLLTHSDEYYSGIIEGDYERYLGRQADLAGLLGWTSVMRAGLSDEQLESFFIGSPEFYLHSGGTNKAWVDAMYREVLGRNPDASGEASWVAALAAGADRTLIAQSFAASPERESLRITSDYENYLGRAPHIDDVMGWVAWFESGFSNESVVAGFVASDEYFARYA